MAACPLSRVHVRPLMARCPHSPSSAGAGAGAASALAARSGTGRWAPGAAVGCATRARYASCRASRIARVSSILLIVASLPDSNAAGRRRWRRPPPSLERPEVRPRLSSPTATPWPGAFGGARELGESSSGPSRGTRSGSAATQPSARAACAASGVVVSSRPWGCGAPPHRRRSCRKAAWTPSAGTRPRSSCGPSWAASYQRYEPGRRHETTSRVMFRHVSRYGSLMRHSVAQAVAEREQVAGAVRTRDRDRQPASRLHLAEEHAHQ